MTTIATALEPGRPALLRRALRLEYLTVGWNLVEGVVAIDRRRAPAGSSRSSASAWLGSWSPRLAP